MQTNASRNCSIHGLPSKYKFLHDLSGTWKSASSQADQLFLINICHGLQRDQSATVCPPESAICRTRFKGATTVTEGIGNFTSTPVIHLANDTSHGFDITFQSRTSCPTSPNVSLNTTILFQCGNTLGSPEFLDEIECTYYFRWITSGACIDLPYDHTRIEVPCYVYDDHNHKRDLTPLIKLTGGYLVQNSTTEEIYINVCRNIREKSILNYYYGCQDKSSACIINKDHRNIGQPVEPPQYRNGSLYLRYETNEIYEECMQRSIVTTIIFHCGKAAKHTGPRLISSVSECQYVIEWITEYACPVDNLLIRNTCYLTTNDGYYLDLNALKNPKHDYSVIDYTTFSSIYFNVCSPSHTPSCSNEDATQSKSNAVCQIYHFGAHQEYSGGNFNSMKLRYVDEQLSLIYDHGSPCSNGLNRSTIILFHCDIFVDIGYPIFREEDSCTYYLSWSTKYACKRKVGTTFPPYCSYKDTVNKFTYNMIPLQRIYDRYTVKTDSNQTIELNICDRIWHSSCHQSDPNTMASVCQDGDVLGTTQGQLDTIIKNDNQLQLHYPSAGPGNPSTTLLFQCDTQSANVNSGIISFNKQTSDGNYILNVLTPLACPPRLASCQLQDQLTNKYNLSRLYKPKDNWNTTEQRNHGQFTYYINFCGSLNPIDGPFCSTIVPYMAACQVDTASNKSYNLGHIVSSPVIQNDRIIIRYINGDLCHHRYRRSTVIHLICASIEDQLKFSHETYRCEYVFTWRTPAACPIQPLTGQDCQVKGPKSDQYYDLSPLSNNEADYIVADNQTSYRLNICRSLKVPCGTDSSSGSCLYDKGAQISTSLGNSTNQLTYHPNYLTLHYTDGNYCDKSRQIRQSTVIRFYCNPNSGVFGSGPILLRRWPNCIYEFRWDTVVACSTLQNDHCHTSITDISTGRQYDLSPLVKIDGSWLAVSSTFNSSYYINICQPLLGKTGCPNTSKSCLMTHQNGSVNVSRYSHNLGRFSKGITVKNGSLYLEYTYGDVCPDGYSRKTTKIIFICKAGAKNAPVFLTQENDCHYYFLWIHEAACSQQPLIGQNCIINHPSMGYFFNLNALYNHLDDYTAQDDKGHVFKINVCGPMHDRHCGRGSGNCQLYQTNHSLSYDGGRANTALHYDRGQLYLNYTDGDLCHRIYRRTTIIIFTCAAEISLGKPMFKHENHQCVYTFVWPTKLACTQQLECLARNLNGSIVDLSPLTSDREGWQVYQSKSSREKILINVCQTLHPSSNFNCPPDSGACAVLPSSNMTYNLGKVNQSPSLTKDGFISLRYDQGNSCPFNSNRNRSTIILFTCSKGAVGYPVLDLSLSNPCQRTIRWPTNIVCDIVRHKRNSCHIYNSVTNLRYNLSSIDDNGQTILQSPLGFLSLSICSTLKNISTTQFNCSGASLCLSDHRKHHLSLGSIGDSILTNVNRNTLKLQYFNGSACPTQLNQSISTTILFICRRDSIQTKPQLLNRNDSSCSFTFLWITAYACPLLTQPDCQVRNSNYQFDLSPLSLMASEWNWKDGEGNRYWLNLCSPIGYRPQGCSQAAAICMQSRQQINAQTLGLTWSKKLISFNDSVTTISFSFGAPMCQNRHQLSTALIHFQCDMTVGRPQFLGLDNQKCYSHFFWPSILACNRRQRLHESSHCIVAINDTNNVTFNANLLALSYYNWNVTSYGSNGNDISYNITYHLNICRNLNDISRNSSCKGSSACMSDSNGVQRSIGGHAEGRQFYLRNHKILEMVLPTQQPCHHIPHKMVETVIFFLCDPARLAGQPRFLYQSQDCKYIFNWPTSLSCPPSDRPDTNSSIIPTISNTTAVVQDHGISDIKIIPITISVTVGTLLIAFLVFCIIAKRRPLSVNHLISISYKRKTKASEEMNDLTPIVT